MQAALKEIHFNTNKACNGRNTPTDNLNPYLCKCSKAVFGRKVYRNKPSFVLEEKPEQEEVGVFEGESSRGSQQLE